MNFEKGESFTIKPIEKIVEEDLRDYFHSADCMRRSKELNDDFQPEYTYVSDKQGDTPPYDNGRYIFITYAFRCKTLNILIEAGKLFTDIYCNSIPEDTLVLIRRNITVEYAQEENCFIFSCRLTKIPTSKFREVVEVYNEENRKL